MNPFTFKSSTPKNLTSTALSPVALSLRVLSILFCLLLPPVLAAQAQPSTSPWIDQAQGNYDLAGGLALLAQLQEQKAPAGSPQAADLALATGIVLHNCARLKPAEYTQKALTTLKALSEKSALAQVWYGSALTIQGGLAQTNKDLVSATAFTDQGLQTIDAAVKGEPDNLLIRVVRVENSISVSRESPFKRWDTIQADLVWMKKLNAAGKLPDSYKPRLALYAGEYALGTGRVNDAIKQFEEAIRLGPKSGSANTARARLAELEE